MWYFFYLKLLNIFNYKIYYFLFSLIYLIFFCFFFIKLLWAKAQKSGIVFKNMGWKVVEINTDEFFKLYLNNLLLDRKTEKILINIKDIDTLIIHNSRASISLKLLNRLTSENVNVIIFNESYEPQSVIFPYNGHYNSFKNFNNQLNWTQIYKFNCWKDIIKQKIFNQFHLLKNEKLISLKNEKLLFSYIKNIKPFDITNREGHASKIYWNSLMGMNFIRDQKCITSPIINAMLNYGYAILRSLVIRSIVKKGLDPRISFFHKSWTNFFSLASDLMEPFRPLVDKIVLKNKNTNLFSYKIKDELINIINTKILYEGKMHYLNRVVDMFIDSIVRQEKWQELKLWE